MPIPVISKVVVATPVAAVAAVGPYQVNFWRPGPGCVLLPRRGGGLGEGDEVAGGVLDGEFFHAVEGGADGHDDFHVFHGGENGVEVIDLHVEIRGAFL